MRFKLKYICWGGIFSPFFRFEMKKDKCFFFSRRGKMKREPGKMVFRMHSNKNFCSRHGNVCAQSDVAIRSAGAETNVLIFSLKMQPHKKLDFRRKKYFNFFLFPYGFGDFFFSIFLRSFSKQKNTVKNTNFLCVWLRFNEKICTLVTLLIATFSL